MNKAVSDSLLLLGLCGVLFGIGTVATLQTGDLLWIGLSAPVCLIGSIAILFLRPGDSDDAARLDLIFGDMDDPKQRWAMVRSVIWVMPHTLAFFLLTVDDLSGGFMATFEVKIGLYALFVVTGFLIGLEGWRFARLDPYFVHLYGPPIAKACGWFAVIVVAWSLGREAFGWPAIPFLALYGGLCLAICGFAYGQDEFKRDGA